MKAAVIHHFGDTPKYEDFPDPIPGKGEQLIKVKAAALENFDRMAVKGIHYSSKKLFPQFPAVAGHAGVGIDEAGQLVGFGPSRPPYGAFAERALAGAAMPIPGDIDPVLAAALPSSILTAYLPLVHTAKFTSGETLLINGATGVTGKVAIQLGRMLGAGRIIGTGRNEQSLAKLKELGADVIIDLKRPEEELIEAFSKENIDVVMDFVWGRPAELLMQSLVPSEAGFAKRRIRYIHIGEKAGSSIRMSGEMLRTSGLELYGTGKIPPEALPEGLSKVWQWIRENRFTIDVEKLPLAGIEKAWQREDLEGKRLVIVP